MTPIPALHSPLPAQDMRLVCHPAKPGAHPLQLTVCVAQAAAPEGHETNTGLLLRYQLTGDMAALNIPSPSVPGAADGLWQHTCFEAFVAVPGEEAYQEFNFSPSGQWAAYRFSGERVRDTAAEASQLLFEPSMQVFREPQALTLQVWLPCAPQAGQTWQMGLSAVVEDRLGQLSYWALAHPKAQPDFHHRDGFVLSLPCPLVESPPSSSISP